MSLHPDHRDALITVGLLVIGIALLAYMGAFR
jgi:hypothetical protein